MNSKYKKAIFYVASGTGNTLRVAQSMAEECAGLQVDYQLSRIENSESAIDFTLLKNCILFIMFPAHGFMAPWSMLKFLFKMQPGRGMPVVSVATRGALKLGRLTIPGASGFGTFMTALILLFKGYRPRGCFSLDMPSNFINFHWGLSSKNVQSISEKGVTKGIKWFHEVCQGKQIWLTRNNLWELIWSVLIFWLIPIFPIIYLIVGRIFMGKLMFANRGCIGCGLCAKNCPSQAIIMKGGTKRKRPYWTYHCEVCLRCMGYCPKRAVETGHSWAILLYFVTSIPIVTWGVHFLAAELGVVIPEAGYWAQLFINLLYFYPALIITYWVFWQLIRIPIINNIFTFSTLTHYYRRYHHPDISAKQLKFKRVKFVEKREDE